MMEIRWDVRPIGAHSQTVRQSKQCYVNAFISLKLSPFDHSQLLKIEVINYSYDY